jgi:predicted nucleotidyltransferase
MKTEDHGYICFKRPEKKLLDEVTRRIVASVKPQRVLLFGSAARGRLNKNSDLDMLVIMRERAGTILKSALQEGRVIYEAQ